MQFPFLSIAPALMLWLGMCPSSSARTPPSHYALLQEGQDEPVGSDPADDAPDSEEGASESDKVPAAGNDYSSWVWWWQLNREPFLDLRAQLGLHDPSQRAIPGLAARLSASSGSWGQRPSSVVIRGEILPALFKALEANSSRQVTTACLIAMARVGEDQGGADRAQVLQRIRPHLKAKDQLVVEAAIMALGILGNESASGLLSELLLDTPYGQRLVGDSKVRPRARAFAAYSIGLLGARTEKEDVRRYGVYMLVRALEKDKSSTPDMGVACVRAIGMTPLNWSGSIPSTKRGLKDPPSSSREAQLLFLMQIIEQDKLHRQVQAFVPTALAQLLNADEEPLMGEMRQRASKLLLSKYEALRRTERELRRSAAMALGLISSSGDAALDARTLKALGKSDRDRITQNWSLMAMGRMAGERPELRTEVRRSLLSTLRRKDGNEAEWAALGLGLLERGARGNPPNGDTTEALTKRLERSSRLSEVGAFAVALGLSGDLTARAALADKLGRVEDSEAKGYLTLSLALLGSKDQIGEIQRIVAKAETKPLLLRDSATALALLGDTSVVSRLVGMLRSSHSASAQASLAQALGRLGDASSVKPLIQMLSNQKATENSRAFAAVALGLVADGDRLPWNTLISLDTNYSAAPATLMDFDGHGILNIL